MPERHPQRPPAESSPVGPRPEEYISELVKAINDNAKIARTTGLALLLTGLYIAAAVFSATDEAILRGSAAKVGQLGIDIPLVLSFSLAPPAFVFLHLNALIQFDLLARQLRRLQAQFDERGVSEADRAHYVSLLTSAAFVPLAAMRQPGIGELYKDKVRRAIYGGVEWLTITGLPVATLLVAQLGFLRQQDEAITVMHTLVLAIDLIALCWFYGRRPAPGWLSKLSSRLGRFSGDGWPSPVGAAAVLTIIAFVVSYGQVAGRESFSVVAYETVRSGVFSPRSAIPNFHPVDFELCNRVSARFCRRLVLSGKTLVANDPDAGTLSALREGENEPADKNLDKVIGVDLRGRSLRFADLEGAALWRANLSAADLTGARLDRAGLAGATLSRATLTAASLAGADLRYSDLTFAQFDGADLVATNLYRSSMQMVSVQGADMRAANLVSARLDGANLRATELVGACMHGVSLRGAKLEAADLRGAEIRNVDLRGASLAKALVWRLSGDAGTELGPTDLRGVVLAQGPGRPAEAITFDFWLGEITPACNPAEARRRLTAKVEDSEAVEPFAKARVSGPILIDADLDRVNRQKIAGASQLTTDPGEFSRAQLNYILSMACVDAMFALYIRAEPDRFLPTRSIVAAPDCSQYAEPRQRVLRR